MYKPHSFPKSTQCYLKIYKIFFFGGSFCHDMKVTKQLNIQKKYIYNQLKGNKLRVIKLMWIFSALFASFIVWINHSVYFYLTDYILCMNLSSIIYIKRVKVYNFVKSLTRVCNERSLTLFYRYSSNTCMVNLKSYKIRHQLIM